MKQLNGKQKGDVTDGESRMHKRAFRKAMSEGLRSTYQKVSARSVPNEFMELLEKADRKRA